MISNATVRLAQMKTTPAAAQHFFHRAAEIDVDDVEATLDQLLSSRTKLARIGAHQLPADRMLVVGDVHKVVILPPRFHLRE